MMMNKDKILILLVALGMTLIAVAVVLPLFVGIEGGLFRYFYAVGAAMLLVGRIFHVYKGDNLRLKRLYRLEMWAAVVFCVGAFMLFYDTLQIRDGLAFTLAGAAIQIYTSIMIPREINRGKDPEK